MTTIQHHLLTGTDLHQCKGADAATSGQVQAADGAGGATWTSLAGDVSGPPGATTVTDLTIASEARGDLLTRGASSWQRLAPGTSGHVLQTNGAGADPTWVAPSGGGSNPTGTTSDDFHVNNDATGGTASTGSVTIDSSPGGGGAADIYKAIWRNLGGALALVQSYAGTLMHDNALYVGDPADGSALGSLAKVVLHGYSTAVRACTLAWDAAAQLLTISSAVRVPKLGLGTDPGTAGTMKLGTVAPAATGEIGMSAAGRPQAWVGGAAVDVLCAGDALPDDYRWTWHHAPGGASSSGTGILAAPTYASGTRGADVTAYGLALTVPSGASVGAFGTIRSPNSYPVGAAHSMIKVLALLSDRTTNIQEFIGWGGSNAVFTSDTASGIKCLGFRFSSTHSDTNICAFINDGTTLTYHDMGVAPSTTLPRWFQVDWIGGGAAAFTILSADGTVLATWSTASSLPASSESMYFWTGHSTPASGSSTTYFYDGRIGFYR